MAAQLMSALCAVLVVLATTFSPATASLHGGAIDGNYNISLIFTLDEVLFCTRIRAVELIQTPTAILVTGRCCGPNRCGSGMDEFGEPLGDNNQDNLIITKKSTDNGQTWGDFKVISPDGKKGYAHPSGVYDRIRKRILFRFSFTPGGSTKPSKHVQYYQMFSSNDGGNWTQPEELTEKIKDCTEIPGDGKHNMVVNSDGTKTQSSTGRIMFPAHNHGPHATLWFTDDGGSTWSCSNFFQGNEISVTQANGLGKNAIYMNGRGQSFSWSPRRADYFSMNDGTTFEKPTESGVSDPKLGACEGSLLSIGNTIYFAEPAGGIAPPFAHHNGRYNFTVHCSKDNAKTWPNSLNLNGDANGAYSGMLAVPGGILVVWEDYAANNVYFTTIDTNWC